MTSHPDRRADLFYDLLSRMTNKGELLELVRHLTFRFRDGEEGFVIDHIANGNTGLVKYNLDLSSLLGVGGCDENPVVVSAVDGLNSIKSADGLKGVIKVRGYLPPDEFFQYIGLLSDTMPTVTFIRDGKPVRKISPDTPYELRDFIHCPNVLCVSGEEFHEHVPTVFYHQNPDCDNGSELYACRYCDTPIHRKDFRLVKSD